MCTFSRFVLLAGSLCLPVSVVAADRQPELRSEAGQPSQGAQLDVAPAVLDNVTVTSERRGAAAGYIPPENVLTRQEVRATGATDINELLEALAPQIGSVRGRQDEPALLLLDGQRVSGFRELRDIPVDAIDRVEILPESVSLTYGFAAHQRVVNVVLRRRYRTTAGLLRGAAASEGDYANGAADVTRVMIGDGTRTVLNLHADGHSGLTEDERDIWGDDGSGQTRSLVDSRYDVRGTFTHGRRIGAVGVTGNIELDHQEGKALAGRDESSGRTLVRNTIRDDLHAGLTLTGRAFDWQWSATGNADASRDVETADRAMTPAGDRAVTRSVSGDIDVVANGSFVRVPAGAVGMTMGLGVRAQSLDSDYRSDGVAHPGAADRRSGSALVSIDLPLSRRRTEVAALGNLLLNANARTEYLSDAGTLNTLGAGVHWSPVPRIELTANWTREDVAPTAQQIAGTVVTAPGTRLSDFGTGAAVVATLVTGGNPDLQAERGSVVLLGANLRLTADGSLRLRADFARSRTRNPVFTPFGATPALETTFPERFTRDEEGNLSSVDLRPLNADSTRRNSLRVGVDLSLPSASLPPADTELPLPGAGRDIRVDRSSGDGASPRVRTLFSPTVGRRFTLSLTDTVAFVDEMVLRDQLKLDYLRGDAAGPTGGRARHEIEGRAGYHDNGVGGLLSARWRSRTSIVLADDSTIRFPSHAMLDLRLFVHLDQRPGLVSRHPWLDGVTIRLEISNLFNTRPRPRNADGSTPPGLQGNLLDPIGRTIGVSFRKGGGGIGG